MDAPHVLQLNFQLFRAMFQWFHVAIFVYTCILLAGRDVDLALPSQRYEGELWHIIKL